MVAVVALVTGLSAQPPVPPVDPLPSQDLPPGMRWSVALPAPPAAPPLMAAKHVFVATLPGLVAAYGAADGREAWRVALTPDAPLAFWGELLFVAAGEAIHALRADTGRVVWQATTGTISAPLLAQDGWVIAASADTLMALRASDGAVIWRRPLTGLRDRPAVSGDMLFLPLENATLQAADLATGGARWERRFGGPPVEPLVVGDRLYVGAGDKRFYCLRLLDGDVDWRIRVGAVIRTRATTDGERVYFVALDNLVRAISRGSGSQRWQQGVPFRPFAGPEAVGGTVLVAGASRAVRMLDPVSGADRGAIMFPSALALAPSVAEIDGAAVAAGITGGLAEPWTLWLGGRAPALSGTQP